MSSTNDNTTNPDVSTAPPPTPGGTTSAAAAVLLNQPIVIDNGTATIKAGFAGGSKPKVVIGNKVGRAKHTRVMPGGALELDESTPGPSSTTTTTTHPPSTYYTGRKLDEHRGAFLLSHPMSRGRVLPSSWDAMEQIWEHLYAKDNLSVTTDEHPVLITETPLNPRSHRDTLSEIFFESFHAPALFVAPPSILSLYAAGRTTGVVLDCGHGVTSAIPVYEGFALEHSVVRSDVGGWDVTKQLQLLLRRGEGGWGFGTT
eukprot:CAMPEP_0172510170 /NCGR_PEP_ID=MMETSP1066-20121228/226794_1 /TAXON_ID=671091 /ORGANISM="Coscinodiscus wailesii, Strain CCMP2513" /LENGTH=257 /DNA_ID=CAMNT_0013289025 /DNA_START=212 /DNA_END=981 /DNA_ORIENTATION=+